MDVRNKKVVVVGLGASGIEACLLLHDMGAIVSATDETSSDLIKKNIKVIKEKYIEIELGKHSKGFFEDSDFIVVSPGVSKGALPIVYALDNSIPILSEVELGFAFCQGSIIAVTGTNGKSTVVRLLGEMLRQAGKDVVVCGNVGNAFCGEIKNIAKNTIVILEVSSFHLEWIVDFRPSVSCILNITEDHLDRYKNFDDYTKAKLKIFSRQIEQDIAILNYDETNLRNIPPIKAKKLFYSKTNIVEGLYCKGGDINYNRGGKSKRLFGLPSSYLKGAHNLENILAATLMALTQGADVTSIEKAITKFQPLKHRIENIGKINDIEFFNDSKATNIDATKRAIEAIDKKIILIAGGRDKGGDYSVLKNHLKDKIKKVILIGEAVPKIRKAFKGLVALETAETLEEATYRAFEEASEGEAVLLSPMCSSFDMFCDYKHRGEVFKRTVKEIQKKTQDKLCVQ